MDRFQAERNADFALELTLGAKPQRFRVNYFMSGRQMGACFRLIPAEIPDFPWAGFPERLARRLVHFRNGLVLVCGVVGSGKTTSLAMEILLNNSAIAGSLRAGKIEAIDNIILTGRADGMLTLDESIQQRLREGSISRETAERFVTPGTRLGVRSQELEVRS